MNELVLMKQSEAENDLQKYVLFKQKNDKLLKAIKDIKDRNALVANTKKEIQAKIDEIMPGIS